MLDLPIPLQFQTDANDSTVLPDGVRVAVPVTALLSQTSAERYNATRLGAPVPARNSPLNRAERRRLASLQRKAGR